MDQEIGKVQKELITEKEFQKIQNQVESQFVQQNSSMVGIAEQLANYHVYYSNTDLINTEIEKYKKVTREDLQRVAKKYLVKENRVVLHYLPKSAQNKPEDTQLEKK
jgi:predicted Zn-dependent peptidase